MAGIPNRVQKNLQRCRFSRHAERDELGSLSAWQPRVGLSEEEETWNWRASQCELVMLQSRGSPQRCSRRSCTWPAALKVLNSLTKWYRPVEMSSKSLRLLQRVPTAQRHRRDACSCREASQRTQIEQGNVTRTAHYGHC
jgi:hypothetical protein